MLRLRPLGLDTTQGSLCFRSCLNTQPGFKIMKVTMGAQAETKPHNRRYRLKATLDYASSTWDHDGYKRYLFLLIRVYPLQGGNPTPIGYLSHFQS